MIFKIIAIGTKLQLSELIKGGANVNVQDEDKRTPLIHAVIENKIEMVKLLVENAADINIQDSLGYTALHYASQSYFVEVCRVLLENKANVDVKDNYGNTPLFRAVFNSGGKGEIIGLLRSYNADINLKNHSGVSPLDLANTIANYNVKQYMLE